jgi:hypothetical protein
VIAVLEWVDGNLWQRHVKPGLVVEDRLQPRVRAHMHVMVGTRDHELIGFDILGKNQLAGFRALDPQIVRDRAAAQKIADLRPNDVLDPAHALPRARNISSINRGSVIFNRGASAAVRGTAIRAGKGGSSMHNAVQQSPAADKAAVGWGMAEQS